jgi:hypothetical protein
MAVVDVVVMNVRAFGFGSRADCRVAPAEQLAVVDFKTRMAAHYSLTDGETLISLPVPCELRVVVEHFD